MAGNTRTLEVVIAGDATGVKKAFDSTAKDATSFSGKVQNALGGIPIPVAAAAAAGVAIVGNALVGAYNAAVESQKIAKETERVIATTGASAWITADQIGKLAEQQSMLTGVDDELIQSGENLLLTFANVRDEVGEDNNIFTKATRLALDMSTVLGTDLNSAILQVGKALNDPTAGMTALSRAGVSFTEDQKNLVKWLQASGDTLGAQKIIIQELEKEFRGAAAAAATPMEKLSVTIGNLQEKVGAYLIPVVDKLATWLGENLPIAIAWVEARLKDLEPWFKAIADAAALITDWLSEHEGVLQAFGIFLGVTLVASLATLAIALSLIIVPIVAIGAAFYLLWVGVKWAWDQIWRASEFVVNWFTQSAWPALSGFFNNVGSFVTNMANNIVGAFRWAIDQVKNALNWLIDKWNAFSIHTPDVPGTDWGGQDIDFPDIPRLHNGGVFNPAPGQGEGLAMLRRGERVLTPGQSGGQTIIVQGHLVLEKDLLRIMDQAKAQGYRPAYA